MTAVNGRPLKGADQFGDVVARSAGEPVRLTVDRGGRTIHLVVTPAAGHVTASGGEALGPATGTSSSTGTGTGRPGVDRGVHGGQPGVRLGGADTGASGRPPSTSAGTRRAQRPVSAQRPCSSLYHSVVSTKAADKSAETGSRPRVHRRGRQHGHPGRAQRGPLPDRDPHRHQHRVRVARTCCRCSRSTAATWPSPSTSGSAPARGRPYYQADVAKLLPVVYAFMAVLAVVVVASLYLDIVHPMQPRRITTRPGRPAPGRMVAMRTHSGAAVAAPPDPADPRRGRRRSVVGRRSRCSR